MNGAPLGHQYIARQQSSISLTFVLVDDASLEPGKHVEGPAQGPHAAERQVIHRFLGLLVGHLRV